MVTRHIDINRRRAIATCIAMALLLCFSVILVSNAQDDPPNLPDGLTFQQIVGSGPFVLIVERSGNGSGQSRARATAFITETRFPEPPCGLGPLTASSTKGNLSGGGGQPIHFSALTTVNGQWIGLLSMDLRLMRDAIDGEKAPYLQGTGLLEVMAAGADTPEVICSVPLLLRSDAW